jgi:hypothetical protein
VNAAARSVLVGLALMGLLIGGCGADPGGEGATQPTADTPETTVVFFPTQTATRETYPAEAVPGTLLEDDGCLFIEDEGTRALLLFPGEYDVVDRAGVTTVVDQDGRVIASVGDQVIAGGGHITDDFARQIADQPLPEHCLAEGAYIVSELIPGGG